MDNIYVIIGETGEYDSHVEWNVVAGLDFVSCSNYLKKLNEYLIENNIPTNFTSYSEVTLSEPILDIKLKEYYINFGVRYRIEPIKLLSYA